MNYLSENYRRTAIWECAAKPHTPKLRPPPELKDRYLGEKRFLSKTFVPVASFVFEYFPFITRRIGEI
jgi:hypothetical protein